MQSSASLIKLTLVSISVLSCCLSAPLVAQIAGSEPSEQKSWTATTESHTADTNPTRTTESHKQSGKGVVDTQTVEHLGPNGHYEPFYEIEKESVQVNGTTTRTIERTFSRDGSGQKILTQVTEEEKQSLPSGDEKKVRTMSNADLDGRLQVVQREVADTKSLAPTCRRRRAQSSCPTEEAA